MNARAPLRWMRRLMLGVAMTCLATDTSLEASPTLFAPAAMDVTAIHPFGPDRADGGVAIAFLSGDMGFRFGLGGSVAKRLGQRGMAIVGFGSPPLFRVHRTRAQVDAIMDHMIRATLERTGAARLILMGQSYGADIVATAAPDIAADLRPKIAAVTMVVPAQTVYFRSDPLGFAYHGEPDARPAQAMRRLDWAPVVCLYGVEEKDSLCPVLTGTGAHVAGLPGGHYMNRDAARLERTLLDNWRAIDPALIPEDAR